MLFKKDLQDRASRRSLFFIGFFKGVVLAFELNGVGRPILSQSWLFFYKFLLYADFVIRQHLQEIKSRGICAHINLCHSSLPI